MHDNVFTEYRRVSDAKVSSLVLAWGLYIHSLDKATFLKPHRHNMLDRTRVEKVWQQYLRYVGARLTDTEYKRGFSQAWHVVREQKLVLAQEGGP